MNKKAVWRALRFRYINLSTISRVANFMPLPTVRSCRQWQGHQQIPTTGTSSCTEKQDLSALFSSFQRCFKTKKRTWPVAGHLPCFNEWWSKVQPKMCLSKRTSYVDEWWVVSEIAMSLEIRRHVSRQHPLGLDTCYVSASLFHHDCIWSTGRGWSLFTCLCRLECPYFFPKILKAYRGNGCVPIFLHSICNSTMPKWDLMISRLVHIRT